MSDQQNIANRGGISRRRIPVAGLGPPLPISLHEAPNQSSVFARQNVGLCQLPADSGPTFQAENVTASEVDEWSLLESGSAVLVGSGQAAIVRIPIPNSQGLYLELKPQGHVPPGGSTSSIFIQSPDAKRQLRLDYGPNKATGRTDYHWNQKGTFQQFGISDHTPAGSGAAAAHRGAKFFRFAGRAFVIVGAAADVYSVVVAKKKIRQAARVLSGWGGAWAGCKLVGAGGAAAGGAIGSGGAGVGAAPGAAIGGFGGCLIGGVGGYFSASWAAGEVYDLIEEIYFEEVPPVSE